MLNASRILKFLLITLVFSATVFANYNISKVHVNCGDTEVCSRFKRSFERLTGSYESEDHFQAVLREYLSDVGYEQLSFSLAGSNNERELILKLVPQQMVQELVVYLEGEKDPMGLSDSLTTKVDSFFQKTIAENDLLQLNNKLNQLGFINATSTYGTEQIKPGAIKVIFNAKVQGVNKITNINYQCKSSSITELLKNNFEMYKKKTFVRDYIQQDVNIIKKLLIEQGHYEIELSFDSVIQNQGVELSFNCKNEQLIKVEFLDTEKVVNWESIYGEVRNLLVRVDKQFIEKELSQFMEKKYQQLGRKVTVKITQTVKSNHNEPDEITYSIQSKPAVRTRVTEVLFRGNNSIPHDDLDDLFYENATDLAKSKYVDEEYYAQFVEILKKKYYSMGMLNANIYFLLRDENKNSENKLVEEEDIRSTYPKKTVIFDINEGVRSLVSSFQIEGLENNQEYEKLKNEIFKLGSGSLFDPIKFEKNINDFLQAIKERGHFDAHYIDNGQQTVVFERSAQQVFVNLKIYLGPIYHVGDVHIVGLNKTHESVVVRKLKINRGDLLTTQLIERIQANLANLALFKSYEVKVLDYVNSNFYRDLVVHLQEKDFGAIEVAPGFRTDLGLRLAGKISYSNLWGLNHSVSLDVELNQRLSEDDMDPVRRERFNSILEYEVKANYNLPDLFKSYWDYNASLSSAKKRFYSFDANIDRVTNTFSHDFTDVFSVSLRQQLEIIDQYNSTDALYEGHFRIGSLTPAFTIDKRNNASYATKGYFLNLSYELAKPEFFSSDSNGYDIDFYRLVSRNRFYLPIKDRWGLALSLTMGLQENQRKDTGFIPPIKVFRLSGIDTVRGFSEEEINKLPTGKDITTRLIQNRVYMTNVKVEPRYQWTDDIIMGLFWDAGKVQIDKLDPGDLRSAAGVSLKYLTPVGTLDFDYGVKLLRKRYPDGTLESPGRIHISIGFF